MKSLCSKAVAAAIFAIACISESQGALRINEIYYAPETPAEGRQFIELRSTTGGVESLADVWLLEIDGDAGNVPGLTDNPGTILTAIDLGAAPNPNTGSNGLFLWRDSATVLDPSPNPAVNGPDAATSVHVLDLFPGRLDIGYEGDENGGAQFFADNVANFFLVRGFTGTVGMDLDTEANATKGNGTLNSTPWTSVLDAVSFREPEDPGFRYAAAFGGTNFQGRLGDDMVSWDPNAQMWAFYDSGNGEGEPEYVGPFFANDGAGFYSPAANDAVFADGRVIHVSADSDFLYATPGAANVSGVGGLFRGDVDRDGDVDAADIDLLYDNLGIVGTRWDVALNFGQSSMTDVTALVRTVLGTQFGDAQLDDDVDTDDHTAWASGFGSDGGWAKGDFNGDDFIDAADYVIWRKFLPAGAGGDAHVSVPEPASACVVTIVAALISAISRRRRDAFQL